ncbi:hypothetical protein EDB81DRAFT_676226 [Dactylonectria macrodidyma]|uniref:Uncharacterized protein n=1 Tax=Dactylonectria macrodidyma TaxID=307937 RepID=A0A9P9FNX6_9HYPO|nr:hypothetical protein EDB81DRAFT_676226 [Dactylonectria macrodidyma]
MAYFGPHLQPVPTDVSVWQWLFRSAPVLRNDVPNGIGPLSNDHGFRHAITGEILTFRAVKDKATSLSIALARLCGVQAHQTVAIVSPNSIWCPVAMFAAGRLGAVVTTLPHEASAKELSYFFQASSAALVFTNASALSQVRKACQMAGLTDERIILLDDAYQGGQSIQELIAYGNQLEPSQFIEEWRPTMNTSAACAFLSFTSGTTGRPKAVMISHANMISQLCQMRQLSPRQKQNTVLGILPFYHITGLVHLIHLPVLLGQDVVIMDKFNMREMLNTVVKYKCNELWVVPPLLIRLLNDNIVQEYDLSFVTQFNTGAAPLAEQIIVPLSARFPRVAIRQAWGMTESTSCLTVTPPGQATWNNATKVGKIVAGTEIRIVDPDTAEDVAVGRSGELWARGPQISMGYLNNSAETEDSFDSNGYLHTGDLGSIDAEGFIKIHDRLKEMIKVRGFGIAPAELEDLLLGHPKVCDAAIVGIPDDYSGEIPRAYIVLSPGVVRDGETENVIKDYVKSHKARHKWLAGGVEFVDAIPKSASGKILRKSLKASWQKKLEAEKKRLVKL